MPGVRGQLIQKGKSHGVMSIRDRKSNGMMKQTPAVWNKCLQEDHRSDCCSSDESIAIIQRFCPAPGGTGEEALMIPGPFAVGFQPTRKIKQKLGDMTSQVHL